MVDFTFVIFTENLSDLITICHKQSTQA